MLNRTLFGLALAFGLVLAGQGVRADPGEMRIRAAPAPENPDYVAGKRAIDASDWQTAIDALSKVVAKEPNNADAYNYLGYAYRRSGQLDPALKNYEEALRIEPKHRFAHEYIGETYLLANNLAKAEEHLKALDSICFFGCEQYDDLKKAVADYKQKAASKQPAGLGPTSLDSRSAAN